jgi:hypothetical protein
MNPMGLKSSRVPIRPPLKGAGDLNFVPSRGQVTSISVTAAAGINPPMKIIKTNTQTPIIDLSILIPPVQTACRQAHRALFRGRSKAW